MSKEFTDMEMSLMRESDVLRQNEEDLKNALNDAGVLLKEIMKFDLQSELYDWGFTTLQQITKVKRKIKYRKTILERQYPSIYC